MTTTTTAREIDDETSEPTPRRAGRPRVGNMINVRVPDAGLQELTERASALGIDRTALVRRYIAAGLAQEAAAPMGRWLVKCQFATGRDTIAVTGRSLGEAIKSNLALILDKAVWVPADKLVSVTLDRGRGRIGDKEYAEMVIIAHGGGEAPRSVTVTIIGSISTLPAPQTIF